jgi:hypothetical protein
MKLTISKRDKKLIVVASLAVVVFLLMKTAVLPYYDALTEASGKIDLAAKRVTNYRKILGGQATIKGALESAQKQLAAAELGLLASKEDALASAEIQGLVKKLVMDKGMSFRRSDTLPVKPISPEYSKVSTRVDIAGNLDQFINLLQEFETGKILLTIEEMKITPAVVGAPKNKAINVALTLSGLKRAEANHPIAGKKA